MFPNDDVINHLLSVNNKVVLSPIDEYVIVFPLCKLNGVTIALLVSDIDLK